MLTLFPRGRMPAPTRKGRREKHPPSGKGGAIHAFLLDRLQPAEREGEGGFEEVAVHMDGEGALLQLREAGGDAES